MGVLLPFSRDTVYELYLFLCKALNLGSQRKKYGKIEYSKPTVVCDWESSRPILCSKWGHFDRAKTILRFLLALWNFDTV